MINEDSIQLSSEITSKVNELATYIKAKDEYAKAIEKAERRARMALRTAEGAAKEKAGILSTSAVNHLQQACIDMSNAIISQTESQKKAFENQKKLAEVMNFLFSISIHNMASYQKVMNDLENKLQQVAESPEDETVKNELFLVINRFKEHEDILLKIENHDKKIKEIENIINNLINKQ